MKKKWLAAGLLVASIAGCGAPAFTHYHSAFKDYVADLPSGWNVYTDFGVINDGGYAETRFIGPFDGDALFGLPSFSVNWFHNGASHVMRDGTIEKYRNADDFIAQTLTQVYGYKAGGDQLSFILSVVPDADGRYKDIIPSPADIPAGTHTLTGLPIKLFIVRSPVRVASNVRWGVDINNNDGKPYNQRMHAYAVISLPDGFYVLSYPATVRSFPHHFARFTRLVTSFHPLTDGPGGPAIRLSVAR